MGEELYGPGGEVVVRGYCGAKSARGNKDFLELLSKQAPAHHPE